MAFCDDNYFEKIGAIQQCLQQSEKRRFELERELFSYCRSEKTTCKIKYGKLLCYLKGVQERERQAKKRNNELLKEMERLQMRVGDLFSNCGALHQKKNPFASVSFTNQPTTDCVHRLHQPDPLFLTPPNSVVARSVKVVHYSPNKPLATAAFPEYAKSEDNVTNGRNHSGNNEGITQTLQHDRQSAFTEDILLRTIIGNHKVPSQPAEELLLSQAQDGTGGVHQTSEPAAQFEKIANNGTDGHRPHSKSACSLATKNSISTGSDVSLSLIDDPDLLPEENGLLSRAPAREQGALSYEENADTAIVTPQEYEIDKVTDIVALSEEGFFHLLESVEERVVQREDQLYEISSISEEKLQHLIRLCNRKAALNERDLGACGAAVLHLLQRLSWSLSKGCLLPEEIVRANWTAANQAKIRAWLPPDGQLLWDRWLKHVLLLKSHGMLTGEQIAELFAPSLVQKESKYIEEAKVLLRTLLLPPADGSRSGESAHPSCNLSPSLEDSGNTQPAWPQRTQELQSAEEDSKEESSVESIPIRETKAYQLLKQSAEQAGQPTPEQKEEEEDRSALSTTGDRDWNNPGEEELLETSQSSGKADCPAGSSNAVQEVVSAVRSKAFWGESDDSDSDIEAALRPPSHHDDTDDFYDD